MKKYMIRCDMEGASGVVSYEQAEPGRAEYAAGRAMFMSDLLAVVAGLRAGGAEDVVIYDEHYYGRNIELARLPACATAICGKPPYRRDWSGGVDESFSGVVLLGFHSKAGTPGGLLPHTYELDIRDLRLNGVSIGEIGMEAAVAGDHGVPVLMVTGDSSGVAEAKALLPGVGCVAVKEALSASGALCYPLEVTSRKICTAAEAVARDAPDVAAYDVRPEAEIEVELNDGQYLGAVRAIFSDRMRDERTLLFKGANATMAWAEYWQTRLRAQAAMEEKT